MKQMTVDELIGTGVFREEVEKQLEMEKASHKDAALRAIEHGVRLKRSPFDSLMERGIMDDADEVVRLYRAILKRNAVGFSVSQRRYIFEMCHVAGRRSCMRLKENDTPGGA